MHDTNHENFLQQGTLSDEQPIIADEGIDDKPDLEPVEPAERSLKEKLAELTVTELKTLILISQGLNRVQAGERLGLSSNTINTYIGTIYRTLGIDRHNVRAIVAEAVESGVLDIEEALAAVPKGRRKGSGLTAPGPDPFDVEEKQPPKAEWENPFIIDVRKVADRLEMAGFKEDPDLTIVIKPGPVLETMIEAELIEQQERDDPRLDFYLASIALLLGQATAGRHIVNAETREAALKNIKEVVEERIRVTKGSKLYNPKRV